MILLLISAAWGTEPTLPERPVPPTPAPGDCALTEPLLPGPVTRTCTSLSVPPAEYADLLATEVWGEATHGTARIGFADYAERLREAEARAAACAHSSKTPPAAWFAIGVATGVALTLGGALTVALAP